MKTVMYYEAKCVDLYVSMRILWRNMRYEIEEKSEIIWEGKMNVKSKK